MGYKLRRMRCDKGVRMEWWDVSTVGQTRPDRVGWCCVMESKGQWRG